MLHAALHAPPLYVRCYHGNPVHADLIIYQFLAEATNHLVGGALCGAREQAAKNKVRMFLSLTITAQTAEGKLESKSPYHQHRQLLSASQGRRPVC